MKHIPMIAITTLLLSACGGAAVSDYPESSDHNARIKERSHNYWYHGDQSKDCDHDTNKNCDVKKKTKSKK